MMRFDLHVHSKYSFDSIMDCEQIVKTSRRKNLNGVAITDHNTILGGRRALEQNKSDLIIVVGSEVNTQMGDMIGLFLNEDVRSRNPFEVLDEIKAQGGVSVFPHPFKGHIVTGFPANEIIKKVDCIEALSSRSHITTDQYRYLKSFGRTLVAGSDAHFPVEIGFCQTLIDRHVNDFEELRKLILSGTTHVVGTFGPQYLQIMSRIVKTVKLSKFKLPI